jgi:hypothetical protein
MSAHSSVDVSVRLMLGAAQGRDSKQGWRAAEGMARARWMRRPGQTGGRGRGGGSAGGGLRCGFTRAEAGGEGQGAARR